MITLSGGALHTTIHFPGGEIGVRITKTSSALIDVTFEFESSDTVMELLLIVDAIQMNGLKVGTLYMDYVPYSRQDRIMCFGVSLSIKVFCNLINALGFKRVVVKDLHSPVTKALLNNCNEITQAQLFAPMLKGKKGYSLICPDAGAYKKCVELAKKVSPDGIVQFQKIRDLQTGEIIAIDTTATEVSSECVIVDDICDGGRTFIEIAKILKKRYLVKKITLMVTHGFFTKGIAVFDGLIDKIYTKEGQMK